MSLRKRRRHHYLFARVGPLMVTVHYGAGLIIAAALAGGVVYYYHANRAGLTRVLEVILAVVIVAVAGAVALLARVIRSQRGSLIVWTGTTRNGPVSDTASAMESASSGTGVEDSWPA